MYRFKDGEVFKKIADEKLKYLIFGAGGIGREIYFFLKDKIFVDAFIDNDKLKCEADIYEGMKIKHFSFIQNFDLKNTKIILASNIYSLEMKKQLKNIGLKEGEDFFHYKDFITLYMWGKYEELWLNKTDIMITSRCTLNCRHCGMMIPYYKKHADRNIDEIKEDIDTYFSIIDGVREFSILGGEPLLYKNLETVIQYIGEKYRDKIHNLQIITNATIELTEEFLKLLNKYRVEVAVSDYSSTLPRLKPNVESFVNKLIQYEVAYVRLPMDKWVDLGGVDYRNNANEEELKRFFIDCSMQCRGLFDKKLYYCSVHCSAINSGHFNGEDSDYIILHKDKRSKDDKINILMFDLGCVEKGYVSYCRNCKGEPSVNKNYVIAAEQL